MRLTGPLPLPRGTLSPVTQVTGQARAFHGFWFVALLFVALTSAPIGARQQQGSSKDSMAGMDMSGDMKDMGPSMEAMSGHMYVTQLRPKQPGDEEKVKAIIAQVKA